VYEDVVERLKKAYGQLKIGDPLEPGTLYGPLHTKHSVQLYLNAINEVKIQGGQIVFGGNVSNQTDCQMRGCMQSSEPLQNLFSHAGANLKFSFSVKKKHLTLI
jgi:hypothetical protein